MPATITRERFNELIEKEKKWDGLNANMDVDALKRLDELLEKEKKCDSLEIRVAELIELTKQWDYMNQCHPNITVTEITVLKNQASNLEKIKEALR